MSYGIMTVLDTTFFFLFFFFTLWHREIFKWI